MSRTDMHAPYWVKDRDPLIAGRNVYCGCASCTGQEARKLARRQERVQLRAFRRSAVKAADREEIDTPLIRGKAW